jgi:hypothetical protein
MSNSGPGFPHAFLGTSHPQDISIGWVEAQIIWGRLSQSAYFMDDPSRTRRLFTALTLGYEPRWIRGLFVGLTRVSSTSFRPAAFPWRTTSSAFFGRRGNVTMNTRTGWDRSSSASVFPESCAEIFGELGRDDYSADIRDFVMQPEHAQAYLLGLHKLLEPETESCGMSS